MMHGTYDQGTAMPTMCLTLYRQLHGIIETMQFFGTSHHLAQYLVAGWTTNPPPSSPPKERS